METAVIVILVVLGLVGFCICFIGSLFCIRLIYFLYPAIKANKTKEEEKFGYVTKRETLTNEKTALLHGHTRIKDETIKELRVYLQNKWKIEQDLLNMGKNSLLKRYFLVVSKKGPSILCISSVYTGHKIKHKPIITCNDESVAFTRIMKRIESPYVMPMEKVMYDLPNNKCLTWKRVYRESIKDIIHGAIDPFESYQNKYKRKGRPFNAKTVKRFGQQILLGLKQLQLSNIRYTALCTANIMVSKKNVCVLNDLENTFLDIPNEYEVKGNHITRLTRLGLPMELACFAHVLFEMVTGYEVLDRQIPQCFDEIEFPIEELQGLICELFHPTLGHDLPTLDSILRHPFFVPDNLTQLEVFSALGKEKTTKQMEILLEKVNAHVQNPYLKRQF